MTFTRMDFSKAVIRELGDSPNWTHVGGRRALVAWMGEESGWRAPLDGVVGAQNNPLNTTLALGMACCATEKYNTNPGVQNYLTFLCGVDATAQTLEESPRYDALRAVLLKPFVHGRDVLRAVADSPWGSFKMPDGVRPNYIAADSIWATYMNNRSSYNAVVVVG